MSINGALVSFSLVVDLHPAIKINAVNEISSSRFFFMIIFFVTSNLNCKIAKVNFIYMNLL